MLTILVLAVSIASLTNYCCAATCKPSAFGLGDSVYTYNPNPTDADTARSTCPAVNGHLPEIQNNPSAGTLLDVFRNIWKNVVRLYIVNYGNGLQFYSFNEGQAKAFPNGRRYWHLDFFESTGSGLTRIYFCRHSSGKIYDLGIGKTCEATASYGDTTEIFSLFASLKPFTSSKTVYVQQSVFHFKAFAEYPWQGKKQYQQIYVPDFKLFIGDRFDPSQGKWLSEDGSPASYPAPSVNNTCQQKAYSLGKTLHLVNMNCSGDPAFFLCQVKFNAWVESVPNQAAVMSVRWQGLSKFIGQRGFSATIVIENSDGRSIIAPYMNRTTLITNLSPAKNYSAKVIAVLTGCKSMNVSSVVTFSTEKIPTTIAFPTTNPTTDLVTSTMVTSNNSFAFNGSLVSEKLSVGTLVGIISGSTVAFIILITLLVIVGLSCCAAKRRSTEGDVQVNDLQTTIRERPLEDFEPVKPPIRTSEIPIIDPYTYELEPRVQSYVNYSSHHIYNEANEVAYEN